MNFRSLDNIGFGLVSMRYWPYIANRAYGFLLRFLDNPERKMQKVASVILSLLTATSLSVAVGLDATAQTLPSTKPATDTAKTVFPDEFSDLDEGASTSPGELGVEVIDQLEKARQEYLKALASVEKKDTAQAAIEFENAISILNDLSSTPRIEESADFTDLVQSIIEDYETHVQSIDDLDENSSIFILRDRLFQAVDATPGVERISVLTPPPTTYTEKTTIPLHYNEFVEKNIQFLAYDKGRKFMKLWLERSERWFPTLRRIASEEGMPAEIVYLAMMESGLNPNAVSWAKAVGMWQFIKSTGEEYDLKVNMWVDERRDVEKATRASMHFLKDLYNELGDWHLALAAYNCGAGGVRRAMRKAGVDSGSFWDIREKLPRETRNYVPAYIATTLITMNREQYGFNDDSLNLHAPYEYETFTVNEPVNLAAMARCAHVSTDSLKALNPELLRGCTPPGTSYELKIPRGSFDVVENNFKFLTDDEKRPWITHKVARKETLAGIAKRYGVNPAELASINGIRGYKARLRRGSNLKIPVSSSVQSATVQSASTSIAPSTLQVAQSSTAPSTLNTTQKHVVRSGDNLTSIAQRYGVRIADLRNWNNLSYAKETIRIGDTLVVSVTEGGNSIAQVERISVNRVIKHKVARGESVASIATLYGTTTQRILELNDMNSRSTLKAGKILSVETKLSKNEVASIDRLESGNGTTHIVRKGESLGSIAALYAVSESDLKKWNPDEVDGNTIFTGSRLQVYPQNTVKGSSTPPPSIKKLPKTYKVRRGDTLSGIADKYGVSIETLRAKNPSLKDDYIRSGQRIRLQ